MPRPMDFYWSPVRQQAFTQYTQTLQASGQGWMLADRSLSSPLSGQRPASTLSRASSAMSLPTEEMPEVLHSQGRPRLAFLAEASFSQARSASMPRPTEKNHRRMSMISTKDFAEQSYQHRTVYPHLKTSCQKPASP
mmetsp:Transcript_112611/g.313241  ORF Transcript_112611/g.313241 Transcript_112611/m.313241 type:complete len:137 (-) Transcript_112611:85-495(-)